MKKKILLLILSAVLLFSCFSACGSSESAQAEATPAPAEATPEVLTENGITYAESYVTYANLVSAITSEINTRLEAHNASLRSELPDSYLFDQDYLSLVFAPFGTAYPAYGLNLSSETLAEVQDTLRQTWPDALLTNTASGVFEASFTYVDRSTGSAINRAGKCIWECDAATGALRIRAYLDNLLQEFTEFIPQGNDRYLLYTLTDRALVEYKNDAITALWFEHRIYEPFDNDTRPFVLEGADPYPTGTVTAEEIINDVNAQYVFTLENDTLTYSSQIPQSIVNTSGEPVGLEWTAIEPITLRK